MLANRKIIGKSEFMINIDGFRIPLSYLKKSTLFPNINLIEYKIIFAGRSNREDATIKIRYVWVYQNISKVKELVYQQKMVVDYYKAFINI